MERLEHVETYLGHQLTVTAWQVGQSAWSWTYLINDNVSGSSTARSKLPTGEGALKRGLLAARLRAKDLARG
jgi:hypothetical protein